MLTRTRIAVFVSGGGTNLQALMDAQDAGKLHSGEIVLVVSNNADAYALARAQKHGIEAVCVPRRGRKQAEFEQELTALLDARGIELILLAGFLCILSPAFVARWPRRILNIHPALLPAFCGKGFYGLHVHEAALARGVKVTGATVHFVNEIPDGGEILFQKPVPVEEGDTPETLQLRVMQQAEWVLLPRAAELVSAEIAKEKQK
jgi:phosphoribosylglycinamide formyltransferase-1